jgi:hypothetical protein
MSGLFDSFKIHQQLLNTFEVWTDLLERLIYEIFQVLPLLHLTGDQGGNFHLTTLISNIFLHGYLSAD